MGDLAELEGLAARLAGGPAFLVLGDRHSGGIPADYAWSGVYTTATDKGVADAFRNDWRTVSSSLAMATPASRSRTELNVCYLLGGRHLSEDERPPADELDAAEARMRAIQELSRLSSETVTPRGVILIDQWSRHDALRPMDLLPVLRSLGPGQGHLFSAEEWVEDPFVKRLESTGQLVLHMQPLGEALRTLRDAGRLRASNIGDGSRASSHVIPLGDGFVEIDIHTWNQVRRSARPIDLELLTPPVFGSSAARYQEFRAFVGAPEGAPRWRGIAADMNLSRDFEESLRDRAKRALLDRDRPNAIVVTGQTATGKSVALAALALSLAREGDFAVLHQSRRTVRPAFDDIDMYATWAEQNGARGTVLIWDGMVQPGEYEALARQLQNRGRKVLIVGSAYRTEENLADVGDADTITAPAELSEQESSRLLSLLESFGLPARKPEGVLDASFLAFLYHALPETETTLRRGLALEMRAAESGMARLVRTRGVEPSHESRLTAMAEALLAAGYSTAPISLDPDDDRPLREQAFRDRSSVQRVTTLVLVAGRHGIPVPIDLALRVLGSDGSRSIRDALGAFDIIREISDDSDDFYLGTRSHLEAELLARQDIPLDVEIEVVCDVVANVRILEGFFEGADEVQFLVTLLERIGPNSGNHTYRPHYETIARALQTRREERGRAHPRLALQESAFIRDFVHYQQSVKQGNPRDRIQALEFNSDLLHEVLGAGDLRGMLRVSLNVELAATLGAIVHEFQQNDAPESTANLIHSLDEILDAVWDARAIDPANLHPVDVLAWSTRDAVLTGALNSAQRLDRLASAVAALEAIDTTGLGDNAQAKVDTRLAQLQRLLGNDDEVWHRLRSLEANTDPAATYFLAKFEVENGESGRRAALERLRLAPAPIQRDWRCSQLLLELAWEDLTGSKLLRGERVPLHLSPSVLEGLTQLVSTLDDADLPDLHRLLFVKAVAAFGAGNFPDATATFREIESITRQLTRRINTICVLADENGRPLQYTARVEWIGRGWGKARVEELATSVWFETRLFSRSQDLAPNQRLPGVLIGFKLTRGAVAEPRTMFREVAAR